MSENEQQPESAVESTVLVGSKAPSDWPVAARISHRILIYASQRYPERMNQYTVEDIVNEEMAKEPTDEVSHQSD